MEKGEGKMKPNIKQLSAMTGFSPATVSNALNKKKTVNEETASKILQAAREIGYTSEARINHIRLVVCRKHGKIVADTPFFASLISGVENECRALGFATVISHLDQADSDYASQLQQILDDGTTANLVLATEFTEEDARPFLQAASPIVLLDCWFEAMDFDTVSIDNTDSVANATTYLINKGHTRIGYLKGSTRIRSFIHRDYGYRRAMNRHGLPIESRYTIELTPSMDGSYKDMKEFLVTTPDLPTAFIADNDNIALGACKALQDSGYRIPEDISVIGFDDIPFCEIASPPLTTVRVFKQEMGAYAVRSLVNIIRSGNKIKAKTQICTEFIERQSVRNISEANAMNNGETSNGEFESQDI
ncbi:MAG: LacI family transcriptional regulator [Firmicutes bacterium]|nr:LacI family transcriptional regulator [Bacillota bacterium]